MLSAQRQKYMKKTAPSTLRYKSTRPGSDSMQRLKSSDAQQAFVPLLTYERAMITQGAERHAQGDMNASCGSPAMANRVYQNGGGQWNCYRGK